MLEKYKIISNAILKKIDEIASWNNVFPSDDNSQWYKEWISDAKKAINILWKTLEEIDHYWLWDKR